MEACHVRVQHGATPMEKMYFADMRARYVLDTQDWAAADRWSADLPAGEPRAIVEFITAFAALKRGDATLARATAARLEQSASDRAAIRIHGMELRALTLLHEGSSGEAIALLQDASKAEEAIPYEFGPPAIVKPTHELLGEVLLEAGRVEEARTAFQRALLRTPLRVAALQGARICAERLGDEAGALELAAQLERVRTRADDRPVRTDVRH
jgi:tetratricopeptide (TPR) repeat protein